MNHFIIMNKDNPILDVKYDLTTAESKWLGEKHIKIPRNMYPDEISIDAIYEFCESRQPPRTRVDIYRILREKYELMDYLPMQMCEKSHGITMEDFLWMKFADEDITYEDVRVR